MVSILITMIAAVFVTAVLITTFRSYQAIRSRQVAPALSAPVQEKDTTCRLWEIRQTQMKMVDAGILTDEDMSICSNEDCHDCKATKQTVRSSADAERRQLRVRSITDAVAFESIVNVDGFAARRPEAVPAFAHYRYDERTSTVVWSWKDPSTGYEMVMKSVPMLDLDRSLHDPYGSATIAPPLKYHEKRHEYACGCLTIQKGTLARHTYYCDEHDKIGELPGGPPKSSGRPGTVRQTSDSESVLSRDTSEFTYPYRSKSPTGKVGEYARVCNLCDEVTYSNFINMGCFWCGMPPLSSDYTEHKAKCGCVWRGDKKGGTKTPCISHDPRMNSKSRTRSTGPLA